MAGAFNRIRAWFVRPGGRGRDAGLDAEIDELLAELLRRVHGTAREGLKADLDAVRSLAPEARPTALATLFCRVEDELAGGPAPAAAVRAQFRKHVGRQWPTLARHDSMAPILLPPEEQEAALCRVYLQIVAKDARGVIGVAARNKLGEVAGWLEEGHRRGEVPPFASEPRYATDSAEAALRSCARGFHGWLRQLLGGRADRIFEGAYRQMAKRYGAAEGFPAVLIMLPDGLVTPDMMGLLRRSQIERILKDKIGQLERANASIEKARGTLEERVRERTQALEQANTELEASVSRLAEAKRQTDETNRAKSEFIAYMSHELRTPLNAILGFSEVLMGVGDLKLSTERVAEYARNIYESGRLLLEIIDDILDTAKLEAGRYTLEEEEVAVTRVVADCVKIARASPYAEKLTIESAVVPESMRVRADSRLLTQMLLNLLSNAMKFTEPGGRIMVEAGIAASGGVNLAVIDSGIGVAEDLIPLMLQPFRQVRASYVRGKSGVGLGLPLVVGLARLHGGEFVLESAPGRGTKATIRLPPERLVTEEPAKQSGNTASAPSGAA